MEAEDLLDKFAQDEGFGNWETVVLNCHHSVIRSVAIAAVNQALRQPLVSGSLLSFEQCLREEFLINTQNYPKEYHQLFKKKFERAEKRFKEQSGNDR